MLRGAREGIFLCDGSKLNTEGSFLLTTLDKLAAVVCERRIEGSLEHPFPHVCFLAP